MMHSSGQGGWRRTAALGIAVVCVLSVELGSLGIGGATRRVLAQSELPPLEVVNLRVGFEEKFRVGAWTPVWITLQAGNDGWRGTLTVIVPDDDETPTAVDRNVLLERRQQVTYQMYVRPGNPQFEPRFELVPEGSRRPIRIPIPQESLSKIEPVIGNQLFIGVLGAASGIEEAGRPTAGEEVPQVNSGVSQPLPFWVTVRLRPDGLPADAIGLDGLDTLVVNAEDAQAMATLRGSAEAVKQWVRRGGRLVVAVGTNWTGVRDSFLVGEGLLPAEPNGTITLSDFGALEALVGSRTPLVVQGRQGVPVAQLTLARDRQVVVLDPTAAGPMIVRGAAGFGVVTVTALSVGNEPFASWSGRSGFWKTVLGLAPPRVDTQDLSQAFASYNQTDLSTLARSLLDQFPGVTLVPFGWVAFFVFVYVLLIGPGDYFFLKNVLKRLELTWITFPTIVLIVSVGAYLVAYQIKGTDLLINQIDIADVDQETGMTRGFSLMNIFSPINQDYNAGITPLPLNEPDPTVIPPAPPTQGNSIVTWFGAAEGGYAGMNNPNRLAFSSREYRYFANGNPSRMEGFRIAMWSSRALMATWTGSIPTPLIQADLRGDTQNLQGTLTNLSPRVFKDPKLFYRDKVYVINQDIPPGGTVSIEPDRSIRLLQGALGEISAQFSRYYSVDSADHARRERGPLVTNLTFYDSIEVRNRLLTNGSLRALDLSAHLKLGRPILLAEIDTPSTRLDLEPSPGAKFFESSFVRILLPAPVATPP